MTEVTLDPVAERAAEDDTSHQAGLGPLNYDELPGLEDVVLEDSFVREIVEAPSGLRLVLMAALGPKHPYFDGVRSDEQHCYRPATLTFPDARVRWHSRSALRFTDATGASDVGNIDRLVALPTGGYRLEGDFGALDVVRSRAPVFVVLSLSPGLRTYHRNALESWLRGGPAPPPVAGPPKNGGGPAHEAHEHDHEHGRDPMGHTH